MHGGGDEHDRQQPREPSRGRGRRARLLLDVDPLRDPPRHDPRRLRQHHPLPRSQPEPQEHLPVGHGQAGHGRLHHLTNFHVAGTRALPAEAARYHKVNH